MKLCKGKNESEICYDRKLNEIGRQQNPVINRKKKIEKILKINLLSLMQLTRQYY